MASNAKSHWLKGDYSENEETILSVEDVQICFSYFQDLEWWSNLRMKWSLLCETLESLFLSSCKIWTMTQKTATQNQKVIELELNEQKEE